MLRDIIQLTQKEKQILDVFLEKGLSNKQIAMVLGISDFTVKLHMSRIMKKHNARTRTQLLIFVKSELRRIK